MRMRQCLPGRSAGARGLCLAGTQVDSSLPDDGENQVAYVIPSGNFAMPADFEVRYRQEPHSLRTKGRVRRRGVREWPSRMDAHGGGSCFG